MVGAFFSKHRLLSRVKKLGDGVSPEEAIQLSRDNSVCEAL